MRTVSAFAEGYGGQVGFRHFPPILAPRSPRLCGENIRGKRHAKRAEKKLLT
jgi:hypothetical protein